MTQPLKAELSEPMNREKFRILAAEDNPGDALLLRENFETNGGGDFEMLNAEDLDQTLRILSKERIDLVLLDLSLPIFLGLEPLARIRQFRPRVPVFILSGYNDPELAKEALKAGAQRYILKAHWDGPGLVRMVRDAIERHRKFSAPPLRPPEKIPVPSPTKTPIKNLRQTPSPRRYGGHGEISTTN